MKQEVFISLSIDEFRDLITSGISQVLSEVTSTAGTEPEIELLSINQVCELLQISKVTLHKWKKQGKIPYHRISRKIYFKKSEVIAHLKPGRKSWKK